MTKKYKKEQVVFPDPPDYLSEKTKDLYRFYVGLTVRAPGQIAMFVKGLEAMDTADLAAELIREEGLTTTSKRSGMSRQHPAFAIKKESLAVAIKVWKTLRLDVNHRPNPDGFGSIDIV